MHNSACDALQTILTELARIRQHGFSQREVLAAINISMADTESIYMERDQDYAQVGNGRPAACAMLSLSMLPAH